MHIIIFLLGFGLNLAANIRHSGHNMVHVATSFSPDTGGGGG